MGYKFLKSSLSILPSTLKEGYVSSFQEKVNQEFHNSSDWFTILEETANGTFQFQNVDARVVHTFQAGTGINQGDDFKTLLFQDLNHSVTLGRYYYFDDNYWLVINTDSIKSLTSSAFLRRCNNNLRWVNEVGGNYDVPCIIDYQIQENKDYATAGSAIILPSGFIQIITQMNRVTNTIRPNQRFLFGNKSNWNAYKVLGGGINNFNNTKTENNESFGLLRLSLGTNFVNDSTDDLVNGIADIYHNVYNLALTEETITGNIGQSFIISATVNLNGVTVTRDIEYASSDSKVATVDQNGLVTLVGLGACSITCNLKNNSAVNDTCEITVVETPTDEYQIVISPEKNYILEGSTESYSVFLYKNGVVQADVFTIGVTSGSVPPNNYVFNLVDGNHFTIKNIRMYLENDLEVNCSTGENSKTFAIKLRGSW